MLIEKSRFNKILNLSLPIMTGMVAVNLMGVIDIAMVGRLGDAALSGVGLGNYLFLSFTAILMGLNGGIQPMVAKRVGEGKSEETGIILNSGILISLMLGGAMLLLGYLILPPLIDVINQDDQVVTEGQSYLMTRMSALFFVGINVCFRAYWNGLGLSKTNMIVLVIGSLANIFFNYVFIFGNLGFPQMGTAGAGLASALATVLGCTIHFIFVLRYSKKSKFIRKVLDKDRMKRLILISIPESIHQGLFFLSFVLFYAIVGLIGTQELAAAYVIISIIMFATIPAEAMGVAATTLVGQTLGKKDIPSAQRWGWETATFSGGLMMIFGLLAILIPKLFLSIFIIEPDTLNLAIIPFQIVGAYIWLEIFGIVLKSALIGAGATNTVMLLFFFWNTASLALMWFVGVFLGYGLTGIFLSSGGVAILECLNVSYIWKKGKWAHRDL